MVARSALAVAALAAGTAAQFAQFTDSGYALSVNVPSDTASSGKGPIFLQISAPSGTQWVGFGQGSGMVGANMLVVYAADNNNVTVSPRLATSRSTPPVRRDAVVSLLEGSGISGDGSLVANIRCDTCLSWSSGSMSPTDSSSSWIVAYKSGSAIDSTDVGAGITQHDTTGQFSLDLTTAAGGSSSNPFVAASSGGSDSSGDAASSSGAPSPTGAAPSASDAPASATSSGAASTNTGGVTAPLATSNPSSSGSSQITSGGPDSTVRTAHATLMSLVFVLLFPLTALTVYIPYSNKVRHIHAPLQVVNMALMIGGLAEGVRLGKSLQELDGHHMIIGYIVVVWMGLFQPLLGLGQHLYFRREGKRSPMGHAHRWIGRAFLLLGIINGGLGFSTAGAVGTTNVPTYAVVVYSVFAAIVFLAYVAVVFVVPHMSNHKGEILPDEKPDSERYEMHGRSVDGTRSS